MNLGATVEFRYWNVVTPILKRDGCRWMSDEHHPPPHYLRYPWCGNNTKVSMAVAGRRYAPISNLHGNVPVIRSEQQSTHVLQPAPLKLDLYVRNISWPSQYSPDVIMSAHPFASTCQAYLINSGYTFVYYNWQRNYFVIKCKAIFIRSREDAWCKWMYIIFTLCLEWHWNITKNIGYHDNEFNWSVTFRKR